jgi:ADP-heptose:LPS heptosyltransferase
MEKQQTSPETILIYVGQDLVGDGLMKLPFVRALRYAFPQARITWLAGNKASVYANSLAPLVEGLIDEVVVDVEIGASWKELFSHPLARRHFDLIIDTQRRFRNTLVLKRTSHQRFVSGTLNFLLSDIRPRKPRKRAAKKPGMVQQLLNLLSASMGQPVEGMVALPASPNHAKTAKILLPEGTRYFGLAPGSSQQRKCWPFERFLALASHLAEQGYKPVFVLGPAEEGLCEQARRSVPDALFPLQSSEIPEAQAYTPMLTIEIAKLLSGAVTNDSGTAHMLAAANTPLVSLFGPTPARKFAPATPILKVIEANDFGSREMAAIPLEAVEQGVLEIISETQGKAQGPG